MVVVVSDDSGYIPHNLVVKWKEFVNLVNHFLDIYKTDNYIDVKYLESSNVFGFYIEITNDISICLDNIAKSISKKDVHKMVCKVISHEYLHLLLYKEHGNLTSSKLDNLCGDALTIGLSGIDEKD